MDEWVAFARAWTNSSSWPSHRANSLYNRQYIHLASLRINDSTALPIASIQSHALTLPPSSPASAIAPSARSASSSSSSERAPSGHITINSRRELFATLAASSIAGPLVRIPLHPLDTCKARMQVARSPSQSLLVSTSSQSSSISSSSISLWATLRSTWRLEGMRGLYAGFPITLVGSAPAACVYLTSYELIKHQLLQSPSLHQLPDASLHFTAGLIAECFSCLLWVPIDVVKERMQVQQGLFLRSSSAAVMSSPFQSSLVMAASPLSSSFSSVSSSAAANLALDPSSRYRSTWHAISTIARTEGLRGIYKGYGATLASFGPYSALYLSGYDACKLYAARSLHVDTNQLPFHWYLMCGGFAGGVAAWLTNPLDMAKLRLQVQRGGLAPHLNFGYRNLMHGLTMIVQHEGAKALFKGSAARVAFFAPSAALNIAVFDSLRNYFLLSSTSFPSSDSGLR